MSQPIETIDYAHFLELVQQNGGIVALLKEDLAPLFENPEHRAYLEMVAAGLEDRNAQQTAFIHAMKAALDKADENIRALVRERKDRTLFHQQQVLMNIMDTLELDTPDEAELVVDLLHGRLDDYILERYGEAALSALRGFVYQVTEFQEETVYEDAFDYAS